MMFNALRRLPTFEEVNGWMERWKCLSQSKMFDECRRSKGGDFDGQENSRDRRRMKEEQWTLEKADGGDSSGFILSHSDDDDRRQQLEEILDILERLKALVTQSIPQVTSRILHATSPILCELSRGYFVPFLTVALACLGRIHTLLLKMGREVVLALQEMVPRLRELGHKRRNVTWVENNWKKLQHLAIPAFVVEVKKDVKQSSPLTNNKVSASQEWNDLMTYFLEVSQDDLTKQMNEFVKQKRWKDAMRRFGLGESFSNNSDATKEPSTQVDGDQGDTHAVEVEGMSSTEKTGAQSFIEHEVETTNDDAYNDAGELVDDMNPIHNQAKKNGKSFRGDAIDDNMARIIQRKEEQRRAAKPTPESYVSKKRKRKKKRKKQDVADEAENDEDRERHGDTNLAKTVEDQMNSKSIGVVNPNYDQEEETHSKNRKEGVSVTTDNGEETSEAVRPDSIDTEEGYSGVVKRKKSKKKASKKDKKQKRKSSSVIDDIFGS
eukprot:CAMPEP_0183720876 /NCGR_PEP_ID=MMETSP0737-20130205/13385_1 /TAXON_ID=385413 /ORGANISM="Thalassiosira miniscula, Strain CCMP1093" /LENGTH=492 /DNA_ID=CAMNT_0025950827 /DNA_START=77 /DNA_END=1555 /DNA_ORIENTATION=-